jgi:4-amino-4-deoxy-L-arabinose transferase-like glycosyltransferase
MVNRVAQTIPYFLALVVILWSLGGVSPGRFDYPIDAPRHALNGAFVYDLIRTGNLIHPFKYGTQYYRSYPALSIPYHPPLFPAIESLFYAAFGVNRLAAALAVALAAGVCVLLFYQLVYHSHGLPWLAAAAALTFITLPISHSLATDVMLEFPALAFALGALYCLRDFDKGFPPSRAYPFALLAGAAVWTKQHAAFLGLVPFLLILFSRNWSRLRQATLWASSLLFGLIVLALMSLSVPVKQVALTNPFVPVHDVGTTTISNLAYYGGMFRLHLGPIVPGWLLISLGAFLAIPQLRRRPESRLYLAWFLALVPLLVWTGKRDIRYLFLGLPALFVLGYDGLRLAAMRVMPDRVAAILIGLLAVCLILFQGSGSINRRAADPAQTHVAQTLRDRKARRVIYCGPAIARLVLAMRFLESDARAIMIRGDKLDPAVFKREEFERFARRYGVDTVVVQPTTHDQPWDQLVTSPAPSMECIGVVPTSRDNSDRILIFDFHNPSSHPESSLEVPISYTKGALKLEL